MQQFDYCVFIGHFSPFTLGDHYLLQEAFKKADNVIIVIGSHNKAPDIENPWSSQIREEMITSVLTPKERKRVKFLYVRDSYYVQNKWLIDVQQQVAKITNNCSNSNICLIGTDEVCSFPQWTYFRLTHDFTSAAKVRDLFFQNDKDYKLHVPLQIAAWLHTFNFTMQFADLKASYQYIQNYKKQWEVGVKVPFPVQFNTVDAVVLKSGHVLVVRRKGHPGRGQIALPGGFLNETEEHEDGALRELKEETKIKLSTEVLRGSIIDSKVFAHPKRSLRGRTITTAFLINLGKGKLPPVQGDDDADKAWWMPLSDFVNRENEFFEDHWHIIDSLALKI